MMNKKTILIAVCALILGLVLGGMFFSSKNEQASTVQNTEANVEVWTCSMHPQIRQSEPGQCPICGMDLIPVKSAGNESDPREIRMSPTAMQLADVRTSIVGASNPERVVTLNGKIRPDERHVNAQASHIAGRVEELKVDYTGEKVRKGQVIARVYAPELVTAQQELLEAQKMAELQPGLLEAAKQKLRNWKLSDTQIGNILSAGKVKENFDVYADQSGVVMKRHVNEGDYVQRGAPLFEVADLSRLWLTFDLHEQDLNWVKEGDSIQVMIPAMPNAHISGVIDYVDPIIDPKTRVARARIPIRNTDSKLKPEMFIKGELKSPLQTEGERLVVPKSSVMWTGERSIVYVSQRTEEGVGFVLREVSLGPDLGDSYVITSGLEAGEEIVTNGTFSVDAAAQLAGKPSMMNPEGGRVSTGHDHGSMSGGSATQMEEMSSSQSTTIEGEARVAVDEIFNQYFALKNALAGDDFSAAQNEANTLKEIVTRTDMKLFKGEAHEQWMTREEELSESLEHVVHYSDIDALRTGFIGISQSVIAMAKSFGTSDTSYVDYCPMVNDNAGAAWLSEQEKILNPYFGSKMLKCGEVKETIIQK